WGGSYGEMKKLAIEAYENSQNNREKTLVLGLLYLESIRGRYSKKEDTEKGLKLFEKAFAYGENSRFYHDRGLFYLPKKGKRWLAIRDFSKELELHPGNYRALRYRAELYRDAGETESALADINDAWAVWPEHAELLPLYEWSLQQSAAGKSVKKSRRSSSVSKKSTIKPPNVEPASSLEVKEAFSAPPSTKTAGLTWLNGRLYMGASYSWNMLYEIDAKSGKVLRKQRTPFGDIAWMPLLANDGKDIYITRNSRAKSTVRLGTTSLEKEDVFKLKSSERSIGDTAIHDGAIYTIGKNSLYDEDSYRLLKFSLEGTLLESFQYHQTSKKSRPLSKRDFVYNIGMTSDGSNLWAVAGTKLLRINPKSGNVEKVYPLSVKQARSLAWDGEKLWTIGAGGTFYTIKVID
ncbi:MAG: hypothetical protein OET90_12045, partial [Desulfuromonadales bacterium]|nr:hypothetical protein [Desulfuromonadales bacterium]